MQPLAWFPVQYPDGVLAQNLSRLWISWCLNLILIISKKSSIGFSMGEYFRINSILALWVDSFIIWTNWFKYSPQLIGVFSMIIREFGRHLSCSQRRKLEISSKKVPSLFYCPFWQFLMDHSWICQSPNKMDHPSPGICCKGSFLIWIKTKWNK